MARASLPPGFRFHPTDVELIMYYLKRKIMGKKLQFEAISELNIYKFCPWDLKDKSCLRSKDLEWFFFCPRQRKYASGARTNRATESGYWKTTGKDRPVVYSERTVGMVKTLIFHLGHAPHGERTDWVMHEYRFEDKDLPDAGVVQDAYVLCKVFKKSGPGPKNGAQYGAPFNEDDYDDEGICAESSTVDGLAPALVSLPNNQNGSSATSMIDPGNMNSMSFSEPGPSTAGPSVTEVTPASLNNDVHMESLLAMFTEGTPLHIEFDNTEELEARNPNRNIAAVNCSDGNDIYNGLGDLGYLVGPSNGGFNFSNVQEASYNPILMLAGDDMAFLELDDLNTPLRFPAEASRSAQLRPVSSFAPCSSYDSFEQFCCEDNFFGAVQNVSGLNQLPPLPETINCLGNHFNLLKENGIGSGAIQEGYGATSSNMYFTHRQTEGSMNAAQAHVRGENQRKPLFNVGSSIYVKAEVTPRVDGYTKDALSLNLGESVTSTTATYTYMYSYMYSTGKIIVANCVHGWCAYNLYLGLIFIINIGIRSSVYGTSFFLEITVSSFLWITSFNHWICIILSLINFV